MIPRIGVYHVDDAFRAQLRQLYKVLIPADGQVLDLCSQHDSHLPTDIDYTLTVHGMNQLELLANTRAASRFTRNFNNDPTLSEFEDDTFDAVLMAVSIQYMQNPVLLISEVRRVLRPGGTFIVSFSNRMFFTKAVEVWRSQTTMRGLADLVTGYFNEAGFTDVRVANRVRAVEDTDWLRVGLSRLVQVFLIHFARQPRQSTLSSKRHINCQPNRPGGNVWNHQSFYRSETTAELHLGSLLRRNTLPPLYNSSNSRL